MVTIRDVADKAGVSIATVSRVTSGSNQVQEETRKKVLRVIKELGYKPRPASGSDKHLFRTIGVMVPDLRGYHYSDIITGVEQFCFNKGFDVMLSLARGFPEKEEEVLEEYFDRKVDGILVCTLHCSEKYMEPFVKSGIPVVAIDYRIDEVKVDSVNIDNVSGAHSATRYLYENGHRRILYIRGPENVYSSIDRERGLKKFLKAHRDSDIVLSKIQGFDPEHGYFSIRKHLKEKGVSFSSVFCVNDYVAMGAMKALMEAGLELPADVSVIGFDDSPFAPYTYPPLTTIAQPRKEMGKVAAQLLIERLSSSKYVVFRNIVLPTRLVVRKSVIPFSGICANGGGTPSGRIIHKSSRS